MHVKLGKLYTSSLPPGNTHNADPFMIFIGKLAATGEVGCEAIVDSGLIDKLLSLFLDDDAHSIQTSYRLLGSSYSAQLLAISMLGCVDLHENITLAHGTSDTEARRLLRDSRKSRIGSESHLTIVPFITRTGVTLLTRGTSNNIQLTINYRSNALGCCRNSGSLDWAADSNSEDCSHCSARSAQDASSSTPASPRPNQRKNTLRRLQRAFSVGDKRQAGQLNTISPPPAASHTSSIASLSRSTATDDPQARPNYHRRSPRNGHSVSLDSSTSFTGRTTGNRGGRLRKVTSDSHLQRSRSVQHRGRLSEQVSIPRMEDRSWRLKRSYSVGDIRRNDRDVNKSHTSNRFPVTRSLSWAVSTSPESGRVDEDHSSSTDQLRSFAVPTVFSVPGLEQNNDVPRRTSPSPLHIDTAPSTLSASANNQDRLCHSPQMDVLTDSPRLSRKTSQSTKNRLQRLKRAFSLNDKPQNKSTNDASASPHLPPARDLAVQNSCDTHVSQDPSQPTPHVGDEVLENSPRQADRGVKFTERGLKHLRRAFSMGSRQPEQRSTGKGLQRLRRAFSLGERQLDGANLSSTRGVSPDSSDSSETPPSQQDPLSSGQPTPLSPTPAYTADRTSPLGIEDGKLVISLNTSQ
jgi:hypothetical protein